jgi:catechol 2,3-dioxygenase-like lactoylglutathione lyase family enzyme
LKNVTRLPGILFGCSLVLLATSPARSLAQAQPAGVTPVRAINHLQVRVTNPVRSYEFYMKLFGGHVVDTGGNGSALTMMLADTTQWLSFGKIPPASDAKPGTLDHAGIGIDLPENPDRLRLALTDAFPSSDVRSPGKPGTATYNRSIYVNDPDGFGIQLISVKDDGHLPTADKTAVVPRTEAQGFVRFRGINHLSLTVTDRERTRDFYATLLGATVRDQNRGQINLTLPGASSWLSLLLTNPRFLVKPGQLHHLGIGIDYPSDIPGIDALRARLKAAFPDGDVRSPGEPSPSMQANFNRSIYVTDPDGLSLQLVTSTDDGWLAIAAGGAGK